MVFLMRVLQVFSLSLKNEFRRENSCMDSKGQPGAAVMMYRCHGGGGNQAWQYIKVISTSPPTHHPHPYIHSFKHKLAETM